MIVAVPSVFTKGKVFCLLGLPEVVETKGQWRKGGTNALRVPEITKS